jgi:putative peptidoglycan lipid II flippase
MVAAALELARDALVARSYGASAITDAFFLGTSLPFMFAGALQDLGQKVLVPWFAAALHEEDNAEERLTLMLLACLGLALLLTGVGVVSAPAVASLLAGPAIDRVALSGILRHVLPVMGVGAATAVLAAYLNATQRYAVVASRRSVNGAVFMLLAVLLRGRDAATILGLAFLLGYVGEFAVVLVAALPALRWSALRRGKLHLTSARELLKASVFPAFVILAGRAVLVVERTLAGYVAVGSVSLLTYARRTTLSIGVILAQGTNTVALSRLSRLRNGIDWSDRSTILHTSIRLVLLLAAPAATVVCVLREPLTRILFGSRLLETGALEATTPLVLLYGAAMIPHVLLPLLLTTLYAMGDTRTPSLHNLIIYSLTMVLDLVLVWKLGVKGIALTYLLTICYSVVRAWRIVNTRFGDLRLGAFRRFGGQLLVGVLVLALTMYAAVTMGQRALGHAGQGIGVGVAFAAAIAGLLGYVLVLRALRVGEIVRLVALIRDRGLRRSRGCG